jgi:glycosyltransferase involved in cell wall biosynthesis
MHIGLICHEYPPAPHGGIGSYSEDLAQGLCEAGHPVTVAGFYSVHDIQAAPPPAHPRLKIIRLPKSPARLDYRLGAILDRWRLRRRLEREHARIPFDLIEVPDYAGWGALGGPKKVPMICRLHGSNLYYDRALNRKGDGFEHHLELRTLRRAGVCVGVSRYALDRTLSISGVSPKRTAVIYNAVDAEMFSPGAQPGAEPGLIVFVNTLNAKKGVEQLIDAAHLVFESRPGARLALIGQARPDFQRQLENRIKPEFRPRIVFAGQVPRREIPAWLRRASVCCYPSHMETFGLAPVEAMAAGRPVIYSQTGPGPEIIEDEKSGLLCDPSDPADIARKIQRLLNNPEWAEQLGRQARQRVLAMFNKPDWIQRNIDFFESCRF